MPLTLTPAASTVFPRRTGSSEPFSQTSTYRRPAVTKRLSSIVAVDSALCPSRWSRWTWTVMFPRGTETSLPATSMSSPCSSGAVKQPMKVSASAEPTTDSTLSVTAHSATFASSRNREAASPAIETSLPSKVTLRPGDSWRSARTRTSREAANAFCYTRRSPEVAVLITMEPSSPPTPAAKPLPAMATSPSPSETTSMSPAAAMRSLPLSSREAPQAWNSTVPLPSPPRLLRQRLDHARLDDQAARRRRRGGPVARRPDEHVPVVCPQRRAGDSEPLGGPHVDQGVTDHRGAVDEHGERVRDLHLVGRHLRAAERDVRDGREAGGRRDDQAAVLEHETVDGAGVGAGLGAEGRPRVAQRRQDHCGRRIGSGGEELGLRAAED